MATTSTKSTAQVIYKVHPLVPLNISEHWTRNKGQTKRTDNVFGIVMGVQNGREIEVHNSFPVPCEERGGKLFVDEEHYTQRVEQYKTVFPELDTLGWYCTGPQYELSPLEGSLHLELCKFIESPIVCRIITGADFPPQKVPLVIFESSLNEPSKYETLRPVDWTLVSEESERIGVDHVTRHSQANSADNECEVSKQIRSTTSAALMLKKRIHVIREYLNAVNEQKLPGNAEILKEAKKIIEQLPLMESKDLEEHLKSEDKDVNCALLIPDMVKLCGSLQHLVNTMGVMATERSSSLGPQSFKSKLSKMGNAPDLIFM
ncbi:csn-6 [Pristionchus pacificus]|uniref:COP9 signalosome complex subunit 6 n=1 Tax=Pristionchus pacificus TaxID=54126 RepID=A0A8R1YKG4_PRIPA|nr:csn-6 [Pristionchus pacificus]